MEYYKYNDVVFLFRIIITSFMSEMHELKNSNPKMPIESCPSSRQPYKYQPFSSISQLAGLWVRNPVCSLIRSKSGISVYRIESEGEKYILKVFEKREDAREIDNYRLLSKLEIPTLPLLGYTENAILLPDVDSGITDYRLGKKSDLSNPSAARAVAKWYRILHEKGSAFLAVEKVSMYDESDMLTLENMKIIAEKTGSAENMLWQAIAENYNMIRSRIDALPRTLTYNDFYWTNLIVSKTGDSAFMFDYNLLGKGIAYADIRNVTGSLSPEAAEAFMQEYGGNIPEEQKDADAFIAPLVALIHVFRYRNDIPSWAEAPLGDLKNGNVLRYLKKWLLSCGH